MYDFSAPQARKFWGILPFIKGKLLDFSPPQARFFKAPPPLSSMTNFRKVRDTFMKVRDNFQPSKIKFRTVKSSGKLMKKFRIFLNFF